MIYDIYTHLVLLSGTAGQVRQPAAGLCRGRYSQNMRSKFLADL